MALSNAERQALWRARQRAKTIGATPDQIEQPLTIPTPITLAEYVKKQGPALVEAFDWIEAELDLTVEQATPGTIGKLKIALETITATLSEYQIAMIDREIERLKKEGATDPGKLDSNLDLVVRFKALRAELNRKHRLNLRNYE